MGIKKVKVIALKVREGKKQRLKINETYEVTEEIAKALVKGKKAKLADQVEGVEIVKKK